KQPARSPVAGGLLGGLRAGRCNLSASANRSARGVDIYTSIFRVASGAFAPSRDLCRRDLETLRLLAAPQGKTLPSVGGMILFGHDRERYIPDAWIQAERFAGSDRSRIPDRIAIHSLPVQAVEDAIAFMQKHSWHGATIGAVRRTDRWGLPPEAVREALINALVHCDYSQRGAPIRLSIFDDRLEIENPGLLPFGLTVDATEQAILAGLSEGQGLATREITVFLGLSDRATRTRLARLIDRGLVREIGTSAKGPQRESFLAEACPP
ncbi:MAG: ATP-binding protein, partial [Synechococcaceae cyanobacterium]|nr:ATP-binding protein [Synechococcaceae cyanobacterium]